MAEEITQTVRCRHCSRALSPSDVFCRSCGQPQQKENSEASPAAPRTPQIPPQGMTPRQTPPPPPSAGATLLKVYLTGMGIAGGLFFGCLGILLLLAVAALMMVLSARPGPR